VYQAHWREARFLVVPVITDILQLRTIEEQDDMKQRITRCAAVWMPLLESPAHTHFALPHNESLVTPIATSRQTGANPPAMKARCQNRAVLTRATWQFSEISEQKEPASMRPSSCHCGVRPAERLDVGRELTDRFPSDDEQS
jgi:hypothetical protein